MTKLPAGFDKSPTESSTIVRWAGSTMPLTVFARRGVAFLLLWICLIGLAPTDLLVGLVAAAAASWTSAWLWPPGGGISSASLPRYSVRFLRQSVGAGIEVAKYAFSPTMRMNPGFRTYRTDILPGMRRDALCTLMSLQPGKLPVEAAANGTILVHCLDVGQAVASDLSDDEAAFIRVLNVESSRG